MKKSKFTTEIVKNYEMTLAGKIRKFEYIEFIITPDKQRNLNGYEIERTCKIVENEILSSTEPITGLEANFLKSRFNLRMSTLAKCLSMDEKDVSHLMQLKENLSPELSENIKFFILSNIDLLKYLKMKQSYKKL